MSPQELAGMVPDQQWHRRTRPARLAVWSRSDPNHLDLFVTGADGKVMSTWWEPRRKVGSPGSRSAMAAPRSVSRLERSGAPTTPTILICS